MPNKHFCQGTNCHQYVTTDRFLKSKGIIRGRYAMYTRDNQSEWYSRGKYFCSTRCESDWLNEHMALVERGVPVPFIRERRFSEGYEKITTTHDSWNGGTYKRNYIQKIETQNS
jgi:hypothetical protein